MISEYQSGSGPLQPPKSYVVKDHIKIADMRKLNLISYNSVTTTY
jgi:hypothetical protein